MSSVQANQDIQRVLGYRYPVTLVAVSPEDGGGFRASIPQLGARAFVAAGDSPQEALDALDDVRQYLIPQLVSEGHSFPEPEDDRSSLQGFSGTVLLRLPRTLHQTLAKAAAANGTSINKLATQLLAAGLERHSLAAELSQCADLISAKVAADLAAMARASEGPAFARPCSSAMAWTHDEPKPVATPEVGSYYIAA